MEQNEHVRTLIGNMNALENSIGEKKTKRDDLLSTICAITKDAWKGLVGSRVIVILAEIEGQVKVLEDKDNAHRITERFLEDMKNAAGNKHCHICDQDINDELTEKINDRIREAEASYGGLSPEEADQMRAMQLRKASLETMK